MLDWRLQEIERRLGDMARSIGSMLSRLAAVEQLANKMGGGMSPPSGDGGGNIVRARVTTAIPAGTWSSPSSSGRAQVRVYDGTTWVDSGAPVTVYNDHAFCSGVTTIAVNKVVKLGRIAGTWWLLAADN